MLGLPDAAAHEMSGVLHHIKAKPAAQEQTNQRSRAPDPADCAVMRAVRTLLEPCDAPQEETMLRELFGLIGAGGLPSGQPAVGAWRGQPERVGDA